MELKDIKNMKVWIKEISEKDCVLFLWGTTPAIEWAFEVMKEWGFKYKTMITWEKTDKDNMGYWFKTCTEFLLIGIKGKVKAFRSKIRNVYREKKGKHSQKPVYFYNLIEEVTIGNKIELFARSRREGWDAWGNEVPNETQRLIRTKGGSE
jgi:N6-adenosine-specific RNA methylase IME4